MQTMRANVFHGPNDIHVVEAYDLFGSCRDGVLKVAIRP